MISFRYSTEGDLRAVTSTEQLTAPASMAKVGVLRLQFRPDHAENAGDWRKAPAAALRQRLPA